MTFEKFNLKKINKWFKFYKSSGQLSAMKRSDFIPQCTAQFTFFYNKKINFRVFYLNNIIRCKNIIKYNNIAMSLICNNKMIVTATFS